MSKISESLLASAQVLQRMADSPQLAAAIEATAEACMTALRAGRKILLAGNGGSAADCQHIAGELVARFNYDRPGLAAVALTVDTSVLTAIGNDYGYETLFARQVEALGVSGDVLFAYSTSGNSKNILAAIAAAQARGLVVVGFTGGRESQLNSCGCDHLLRTPSTLTPQIQEGHLVLGHLLCGLIEDGLYGHLAPQKSATAPAAALLHCR